MATSNINSVNLLPTVLQTDRNAKFLASTIDQLIQPAQLQRLDGYIGSTLTPTYNSTSDVYISGNIYDLDPALVTNDSIGNIQEVQGYDDLINEISIKGGFTNNLDRLFRSKIYSYNAHIDWDKLDNYQDYYWLTNGPQVIEVTSDTLDIESTIIGQTTATINVGTLNIPLSNGMLITFGGIGIEDKYREKEFFVEGVGNSIILIPFQELITTDSIATAYTDRFDTTGFDDYSFDDDRAIPVNAEYITINRASQDLNPWSRYNRWVHQDIITISAYANGEVPVYPAKNRAQRPIVEFESGLQLFNFGSKGIQPIDIFDTVSTNAFLSVNGTTATINTIPSMVIDGVTLAQGHRIIFNEDSNPDVRGKIYSVNFAQVNGYRTLTLVPADDHIPDVNSSVVVADGSTHGGTSWWYDGNQWQYAQQRTVLNQAPLFDLYDENGNSYSDKNYYLCNFTGNQIFGYKVGTGTNDPYLGFPLSYKKINAVGSFLFSNYLADGTITISFSNRTTAQISTNIAYCKKNTLRGIEYNNSWQLGVEYPIPLFTATSGLSYYQEPLSLTNNPLNSIINQFTVSELSEHVGTMIPRLNEYKIDNLGAGNLRDLGNYTSYGIKLIVNDNPISFAQMFIGKKENSVIDAIAKVGDQYNQFKLTFLNSIVKISNQLDPVSAVDEVLTTLNQNNGSYSPYYLSDMLAYGSPEIQRTFTVTDSRNVIYPLSTEFDLNSLSLRSVLVYLNGTQLVYNVDYTFDIALSAVNILTPLNKGNILVVKDFTNTEGAYIPPTPTKLGMYPSFVPSIYQDNTYLNSVTVIQGHDGSIMPAYNDYRDAIILELEKRIYNNIKTQYRPDLLDINSVIPGAFRNTNYLPSEIIEILSQDFIKWTGTYSIDYSSRSEFDINDAFTWNFNGSYTPFNNTALFGSWRSVYKYFYDTDRPHTNPWEMLGFTEQPNWWTSTYGTDFSSNNTQMWTDLEDGYIAGTSKINSLYARPGLSEIIPTYNNGALKDPAKIFGPNISSSAIRQSWVAGDQGPAETAWRRSSLWPYTIQKILTLTIPATYASLMYDTSRMKKNIAGQWTYGTDETFLQLNNLYISGENNNLTSGYSVLVSEVGQQRTTNYISELRQNLDYANYNLFYKVGGFVDQSTLQIIIDAYDPTSTDPGAILPSQNYQLILDVSNPIRSASISGFIVQKSTTGYIVKGYDSQNPYFTYYPSIRNLNTQAITVGGKTASYVTWSPSGSLGATGLDSVDITTAQSAVSGNFYQKGQIVLYSNNYYKVTVAHQAEASFNPSYYQILSGLPSTGGATVQIANNLSKTPIQIPYGTTFANIQEVYDLITGYGRWIEDQGFVFTEYNKDLDSVLDWSLTAQEFLYWTTQNWSVGSILTLSPFADQIVYQANDSVVDNLFNGFYDYSILKADGSPYPQKSLSISRNNGVCTIATLPNTDGIYFARLNCVQKQHAIVFDNIDEFGDVIYDIQTGSRQMRMKLVGFKTAGWNGDFFSPGFVYDNVKITNWTPTTGYLAGSVVYYNGNYYSAIGNIDPSEYFNFSHWDVLTKKPVPGLLPNFDYKISQFTDFYSLDIDNFDAGQEKMAQHLTGYTPRVYLNNIFTDPISQYKFYQGYIKQKGTENSISTLAKATIHNLQGQVSYNEEWAFRIGDYGSYTTYQELEVPLVEGTFLENPQIINFVDTIPNTAGNNLIHYNVPSDLTISPNNYSPATTFASTSDQSTMILTHSGYIRIDDVTATAYNENSLLDIANNSQLSNGDTIWLGFTKNGDWDVYRYTYNPVGVIGVYVSSPVSQITFTTSENHGLSVGQIVSVSNFNSQVDGIYIVQEIPKLTQFTVASTLASITNSALFSPGKLYEFKTARISEFDNLPSDKELYKLPNGTKFWIDSYSGNDQNWSVYEKINNYSSSVTYSVNNSLSTISDGLGQSISKRKGSNVVVVGATNYNNQGEIFLYNRVGSTLNNVLRYSLNRAVGATDFGYKVVYDDLPLATSNYGLIFASAPSASFSTGIVKISAINSKIQEEGVSAYITNPDNSNKLFGTSIWVQRHTKNKLVLIGAPGQGVAQGATWAFNVYDTTGTIHVSTPRIVSSNISYTTRSQWGYSISGSDDASYIAISAPGYFTGTGIVSVIDKNLNYLQTITSPFNIGDRFGEVVSMSVSGDYLIVSAPTSINTDLSVGKVAIYNNVNGIFVLNQTIENPVISSTMNFGKAIDITTSSDTLVISAQGINSTFLTTFDQGGTYFDGGITQLTGTETSSGAVYMYYRHNQRFVLAQELTTSTTAITSGTNFGIDLVIDDGIVLVGAPALNNTNVLSAVYQFSQTDLTTNSLSKIRSFENLTIPSTVEKISLIDTYNEDILQYLDVIDPLKGKIAGIAEQELTYKLISDPAIYSIGLAGVNVDTNTNWLDDHVGELWWDLSTAKYVWYEQSDLEYRKNNWGKLFPGATIDVYEWVGSTLLPSEWSTQADTTQGLTLGISGQPKFPDNSIVSVKQVYDNITNSYSNVYYYWVKNSVIVPNAKNRRKSSYEVASIIADPTAYGLQFAEIIAPNAVALNNLGSMLVNQNISLNIGQDIVSALSDNPIPKHTEWLILQENNENSIPNALLEKKLFDSLLGHDSLGNIVPDPSLSVRTRYGIGIRPRQTFFKDRLTAIRNIVEFSNSILINEQITGNYDFINLNSQESIPDQYLNIYDKIVESNTGLLSIDTSVFQQAVIQCLVDNNGHVTGTNIINAGYGYGILNPVYDNTGLQIGYQGPTFDSLVASGSGVVISTVVSTSTGAIIQATVINGGTGYIDNFNITSRPQSVVVISDDTFNGGWTQYEYNYITNNWIRARTQSYNTTLYWKYVDWSSSDYNQYQIYSAVIGSPYELGELTLVSGQYIKINNGGDGNYIVVEALDSTVHGTFGQGFNLVYKQNGTIQLLDIIWSRINNNYTFDYNRSYDQTLWDQTPDLELEYILTALKDNIFINNLKINWNLLFFKAVRYALSEQKLLDWAFKTSFINVVNKVGQLGQPPVYKLQDSSFYQQYIEEVKPYHTQIRNFTTQYSDLEPTNTYITDFDHPSYWNTSTHILVTPIVTATDIISYPVRKIDTTIKFDRISKVNQIGDLTAVDTFICNGYTTEFVLNWLVQPDKTKITIKLIGSGTYTGLVVSEDYTIISNDIISSLVFLNYIPQKGQTVIISYQKNVNLLNAAERILNFYEPTPGMPGLDLAQLMTGIEYPGLIVGGQYEGPGFSNPFAGVEPDSFINTSTGGLFPTWNANGLINGLGINPEDITIDGEYGFVTPNTSYAPEEVVPGFVTDSLGINVYTKNKTGAPIVINGSIHALASTSTQTFALSTLPTTIDNITVIYNNVELIYNNDTHFTEQHQYTIDWVNSLLVIPPQINNGILGYTIIEVGGGDGITVGVTDKGTVTVSNTSTAVAQSLASYIDIKDAFVTVNGIVCPPTTDPVNVYGFTLTPAGNNSNRAAVTVYNLTTGTNTIQAWFFTESQNNFNVINEQVFYTPSYDVKYPFSLLYPPGKIEPVSQQVIVEITDTNGTRRLLPPDATYYSVTDPANPYFNFSISSINSLMPDPENYITDASIPDNENVYVYHNGVSLKPGIDYNVNTSTLTVHVFGVPLSKGDAIAIEAFVPNVVGTDQPISGFGPIPYSYQYRVVGSNLYLTPEAEGLNFYTVGPVSIKVITYADADGMLAQTQKFVGNSNRRFSINRPIFNDNYVFVTVFKYSTPTLISYPLVNGIDYIVLDDNITIQLNDNWKLTNDDIVEITSFGSHKFNSTVLGYRIFNDMLGNTSFTRLSEKYSTYLTQPLLVSDKEIHVADTTMLTAPQVDQNIPGVVLINAERIEFFQINGNALTQLRRGTLGTSPSTHLEIGTAVIDQGVEQRIPFSENLHIQNTFTNTTTNIYTISTDTVSRTYPNTSTYVRCDGITLSTSTSLIDQIEVYYGGRLLRKSKDFYHETTASYTSIDSSSILGSISTVDLLPINSNVGDSYLVTNINQVWTFTGSRTQTPSTTGWVYSGLTCLPQEYTISINTLSQLLILNTSTLSINPNLQITIVQKDFSVSKSWNTVDPEDSTKTLSLLDSTTTIALFLQDAPAVLPNNYFYGL